MVGGRRPSVEDNFWGMTTFGGRQPLMEDNLWWKMTFGGRRPLVEDKLRLKTTFGGRQPLVEDNLCWKTTLGGRQPSVKDDLWWKTTCSGRRPSAEDDLYWILACCLLRFAAFFENILNFMYHFLGTAGLSKVSHQSPVCPPLDPWSPPRAPPQKICISNHARWCNLWAAKYDYDKGLFLHTPTLLWCLYFDQGVIFPVF